jgi:hypothetical protein
VIRKINTEKNNIKKNIKNESRDSKDARFACPKKPYNLEILRPKKTGRYSTKLLNAFVV